MDYNKLVRDKIPQIIQEKGAIPFTHIASDDEYIKKLDEKLQEELNEFLESRNQEELADMLEVIYAICKTKNITKEELEKLREQKSIDCGSFNKKIILDKTE